MSSIKGINPAITPEMMANPMIVEKSPLAPPTPPPLGVKTPPPPQGLGGKVVDMTA